MSVFFDVDDIGNVLEGNEGPLTAPSPFDSLLIQHLTFSGLESVSMPGVTAVRFGQTLKLDKNKASGRDGSTLVKRGVQDAAIELSVKIWTSEQWAAFWDLIPRIWSKPGISAKQAAAAKGGTSLIAKTGAISVYHPTLADWGVSAIVIEAVEGPDVQTDGTRLFKFKCLQYVPPSKKDATSLVSGSKPTYAPFVEVNAPNNSAGKPPSKSKSEKGPA